MHQYDVTQSGVLKTQIAHLSEEVAQEECEKRNHKQVHQGVGAVYEALCLRAHTPIALQPSQDRL